MGGRPAAGPSARRGTGAGRRRRVRARPAGVPRSRAPPRRVGVRREPHRCDGGEPADGTGVVVVLQGRDPAVPLQFDREIGGRGLDARQGGAQRAAQQLGEAHAECGGGAAGHAVAHLAGEYDRGLAQVLDLGQQGGRLQRGDPVSESVGRRAGPCRQRLGVLGVGRGRRWQGRTGEGGGQIVQEDQPGHRVDGEVVDGDHQGAARRQPGERDDVPGFGVEPSGGLVRRCRGVGGVGRCDGDLAGGFGAQGPHAVLDAQPQPQDRVCGHDGVRGAPDVGEVGALGRHHRPGLGETGE